MKIHCLASLLACSVVASKKEPLNRSKWLTSSDTSWSHRYLKFVHGPAVPGWKVVNFNIARNPLKAVFDLENLAVKLPTDSPHPQVEIQFYQFGAARVKITEGSRFSLDQENAVLDEGFLVRQRGGTFNIVNNNTVSTLRWTIDPLSSVVPSAFNLLTEQGPTEIVIEIVKEPRFMLRMYADNNLLMEANGANLLNFEVTRTETQNADFVGKRRDATTYLDGGDGLSWHDNFSAENAKGPRGVGLDFRFCKAEAFYGLAEHSTHLNLSQGLEGATNKAEPYRFWNTDIQYDSYTPMPLYATVPLLIAPRADGLTSGLLWINAADTYVKLDESKASMSSECPDGRLTWFASETGAAEFLMYVGGSPTDITRKYSLSTGTAPLQEDETRGVHQSRWSYETQAEVARVNQLYDEAGFPLDFMWLDIDYSVERQYFVWDKNHFPDPTQMVASLAESGRSLVAIVDPHIKSSSTYDLYRDNQNLAIVDVNNSTFHGWCWPGDSIWLDVLDPEARQVYINKYKDFEGSAPMSCPKRAVGPARPWLESFSHMQLWNDMNEPSVFNGPEGTAPRSLRHRHGGYEHREVHNLYSSKFVQTTAEALRTLRPHQRPFILTRAAFIGDHKQCAIWTGDNESSWDALRSSIAMILNLAYCGFSNTGADIGGFFDAPDSEMALRWIQIGIWYPFARLHSTTGSVRREPYLLPEPHRALARQSFRLRYRLSPFWKTIAALHSLFGLPMITSVGDFEQRHRASLKQATNSSTIDFGREDGFMVGDQIFVRPRIHGAAEAGPVEEFTFPGAEGTRWYDIWSDVVAGKAGAQKKAPCPPYEQESPLERVPEPCSRGMAWVRGGTVLFTKQRPRRSIEAQRFDPFTVAFYIDTDAKASGFVYLDDGKSSDAVHKEDYAFALVNVSGQGLHINAHFSPLKAGVAQKEWTKRLNTEVERIRLAGVRPDLTVKQVKLNNAEVPAKTIAGGIVEVTIPKNSMDLLKQHTVAFVF